MQSIHSVKKYGRASFPAEGWFHPRILHCQSYGGARGRKQLPSEGNLTKRGCISAR